VQVKKRKDEVRKITEVFNNIVETIKDQEEVLATETRKVKEIDGKVAAMIEDLSKLLGAKQPEFTPDEQIAEMDEEKKKKLESECGTSGSGVCLMHLCLRISSSMQVLQALSAQMGFALLSHLHDGAG
jgi:4-diphosphocytidyl-2C-methyl-D-erythritol kinase